MHAMPFTQSGLARKLKKGLLLNLESGLAKLNPKRFAPTTNSFKVLGLTTHRQATARFFGVRKVSTTLGNPGKMGKPRFAVSPNVFWCPADQRTNALCRWLKV